LRGRVSSSWGQVYSIYYPTAGMHEIETWLSDVIRTNLDLALSLWHYRNGVIYGIDTKESERTLIATRDESSCGTTCTFDMSGDDSITTVTYATLEEASISDSEDISSSDGTTCMAFSP